MERRLSSRPLPLLTQSDWLSPDHLQFQNNDNPFIRLVQNRLVVQHLAEYLYMEDLKALTLVSRDCLNSIRNTKSFSTRARFTIRKRRRIVYLNTDEDDEGNKDVEVAVSLDVLQRSTYNWRNMSIELGILSDREICEIRRCLETVESVLFFSHRSNDAKSGTKVLAEWLLFKPILEETRKLRELEIYSECIMLKEKLFDNVLQQIFSKVDSLLIGDRWGYYPKFRTHKQHIERLKDESKDEWLVPPHRLPPRLYSHLKKFCVTFPNCMDDQLRTDHCSSIVKIVDLKKDTLEELQFHDDVFRVEEMKTIRLPKLKRLLLKIDYLDSLNVAKAFLQNQVPLEELRISMMDFPLDLLQCLEEADKVGKMQRLCIQAGYRPPAHQFFLKGMRKLKVVHFVHVPCDCYIYNAYDYCFHTFDRFDELEEMYPQIRFNELESVGSSCLHFHCDSNLFLH